MEFLKEFLSEETYSQVEAQLKGNDKVKVVNLASGEYVSKSKFDDKVSELDNANTQIGELNKKASEFDGSNDELKTQFEDLKTKYESETKALKDGTKISEAIDEWLEANPTKHRSLIKSQFKGLSVNDKGEVEGIETQGTTLKEKYEDMFASKEEEDEGGDGGFAHKKPPTGKDPSKMSMEEYKEWREAK